MNAGRFVLKKYYVKLMSKFRLIININKNLQDKEDIEILSSTIMPWYNETCARIRILCKNKRVRVQTLFFLHSICDCIFYECKNAKILDYIDIKTLINKIASLL